MVDGPGGGLSAPESSDLRRYLGALRTQLWWREALVLLTTSFALGSAAAAVFAVWAVGRGGAAGVQSLELVAMTVLAGIAVAFARRPSVPRAARAGDRRAGFENRLATSLEILEGRMWSELAPLQLAETWHTCRSVSPRRVLPFGSPALRGSAATGLAMVGLALLVIGHADDLRATLDRLAQDRQSMTLQAPAPPEEAASGVDAPTLVAPGVVVDDPSAVTSARLREELQKQDLQSRTIEEAVAKLADALKGTAAAGDVAASLQRQDYAVAANQLRDLARESDQLSTPAKQELARALLQASKDSAKLDQSLAVAEQEAARSLGRGDYQGGRAAMDKLADLVASQQRTVIASAEVAKRLQSMQNADIGSAARGSACGGGDDYVAAPVDCAQGPSLYTTGGMRALTQSPEYPSPLAGGGELSGGGGYASGGNATNPLGEAITRLDAAGDNPMVVEVNPTGAQGRGGQPDPKAETSIITQADQKNVTLSGVPQPSQPVVDTPESTVVSPAQRQAVRGFFRPAAAERER